MIDGFDGERYELDGPTTAHLCEIRCDTVRLGIFDPSTAGPGASWYRGQLDEIDEELAARYDEGRATVWQNPGHPLQRVWFDYTVALNHALRVVRRRRYLDNKAAGMAWPGVLPPEVELPATGELS